MGACHIGFPINNKSCKNCFASYQIVQDDGTGPKGDRQTSHRAFDVLSTIGECWRQHLDIWGRQEEVNEDIIFAQMDSFHYNSGIQTSPFLDYSNFRPIKGFTKTWANLPRLHQTFSWKLTITNTWIIYLLGNSFIIEILGCNFYECNICLNVNCYSVF